MAILRRKSRGAATVEAILSLIVFILLWIGVAHVGALYALQLETAGTARGCAWIVASNGCQNVPPECEATTEDKTEVPSQANQLSHMGEDALSSDLGSGPKDALTEEMKSLFGRRTNTTASREHKRPPLLGGETTAVSATHQLPCNSVPRTPGEMVPDMIKKIRGKDE